MLLILMIGHDTVNRMRAKTYSIEDYTILSNDLLPNRHRPRI